MPWVKIDDHFDEHPKLAQIGPLGWGVWLAGLAYCNRNLTDGFIPEAIVGRLIGGYDEARDIITDLANFGLWEEVSGGYQIHDFADFQPTKAQVQAEREQKRSAGRAGGLAAARARAAAESQQNRSDPSTVSTAESKPVPVPDTEPEPVPESSNPSRRKRRATALPDDWKPDDELRAWATETYPSVDARLETQKFRNHAQANDRRLKDWRAGWRNWIINAATKYASPNGHQEPEKFMNAQDYVEQLERGQG